MQIDIPFIFTAFVEILKAIPLTMVITMVPLIVGFGIGIVVGLVRLYKIKGIHRIADFYVSFLRGTPALCISCSFI
jgi:L-cystine transport system permease protein